MSLAALLLATVVAAPALVVTTETIPRGGAVDLGNVELVDRADKKLPRMLRPFVWSAKEALRARRTLRAGTIVSEFDVEPMPAVSAGDPVTVTLSTGRMLVTATAVAKEDGFAGETIWVQNPSSQRRLRVQVVEPGRVRLIQWRRR